MKSRTRFADLLTIYRAELLESVVPFWLNHAVDSEQGGIFSCIADDGTILSRDKYMWSQLRAIWTFSALYNRIEPRPEWLDIASRTVDFVTKHGRDDAGRWLFAVDRHGNMLEGATSIYADGFAIYGLTEYARATGDREAARLALETYGNVQRRLARPGSYASAPYPIPTGAKAHGISMIFSLSFHELGLFLGDQEILSSGYLHARDILDSFLQPSERVLLEFVQLDGTPIESPQGRAIVPGHAIESMWFLIHILSHWHDEASIRQAVDVIRWHMELGWDEEFGGILLARDAAGLEPWWPFADAKLWWPHTEALYALLLAYEITRAPWALSWFERVHEYAFDHFPAPIHGEWTQKLDRAGRPFTETVALPVKDPFHLPRALIMCTQVLERLRAGEEEADAAA